MITIGLSLWLARSIVGPLRTLTRSANEVADERLPGLVDRLQHAKDPRDLDVVPEPVPVNSNDEIGQVSAAFNSVHRVAIQVATEQAALRKSIGDMFLNLARRSQSLIDRQLELIDDLERTEADPDALDNLFKLDHLATRMRRNAEDLIVLSGAEPARRWSQPVPLVDVVRAALAEVEDYNRVELLPIDDIGVAGQAVSDVVHLLAELIENATSFSPPGTKVQVAGQQVSNGYVLEIEDRGLGMTDDELVEANERLANPPMVDFALSRMLGLYVVARLAQRYDIKVQLRHSWYGGITALVLLPPTVAVRAPMPEAIEAPARRGPAELVPSTKPVEPVAEEGGEHLPIFEAARSDWFEDSVRGDHLPLRRHAAQQPNGRAAEPTGNGAGTLTGAGATRLPAPDQSGPAGGAGPVTAVVPTVLAPTGRAPTRPGPTRPGPRPCGSRRCGSRPPGWRRPESRRPARRRPGPTARGRPGRRRPRPAARPRPAPPPRPRPRRPQRPGGIAWGRGRHPGPHRPAADQDPGGVGPAAGRRQAVRARDPARRHREPLAPASPPSPGRSSRRAGADRVRADRTADRPGPTGPRPASPPPRPQAAADRGRGRRGPGEAPGGLGPDDQGRPSPQGPAGEPRPRDGRRAHGGDRRQPGAGRQLPALLLRGQVPGGGPQHAVELPLGPRARPDGSRRRCRQRRRRPLVLEERRR